MDNPVPPVLWFANDESKWRIYTCLKDWILYTEFMPGQQLNERNLAKHFGISRTPMREVLQLLCYQGLLVIKPRQGVFVAPIEPKRIRETFEVRLPLEITVARLAAQRAEPDDVKRLKGLAESSAEALKSCEHEQVIRLDAAFHDALAKAARNLVLRQTRESLHNICLRYWFLILDRYKPDYEDIDAHARLASAIEERDVEQAADIHARHVGSFIHILEDSPPQARQQEKAHG